MPVISIFIPLYNAGPFLSATIQSVLDQTYENWELVILDDASSDNSYTIAASFAQQDKRIKVFKNSSNLGMLGNWNKGIALCHAPYFVKLDADDIWHTQMLEKAMQVLDKHPNVGLVFSRYVNIDEWGVPMQGSDVSLPFFAANKSFSCLPIVKEGPDTMLSYPILRQGLSVMRREVFDKVGVYKYLLTKDTQAATDTEFYFRVGAHYDIYCIDEVLYQYRVHNHSISAVDAKNFLTDQKLYEIKHCIINYYAEQGFLSSREKKLFLNNINSLYGFVKVAKYKHEKDWNIIAAIIRQCLRYPVRTAGFYFKRLMQKLSS